MSYITSVVRKTPLMKPVIHLILTLIFLSNTLSAETRKSVLIFGGTGALGYEIVSDLVETQKYKISVFARVNSNIAKLLNLPVTIILGDVLEENTVKKALQGNHFNIIVDALASDSCTDMNFYKESMAFISKWATLTEVNQIILHGSVGSGLSRSIYPKGGWTRYAGTILSKDLAERHLIESGTPYTIIRHHRLLPQKVKGSGHAMLTVDQLTAGAVTRDGLARLTLTCISEHKCINEIYHAYDPKISTQ